MQSIHGQAYTTYVHIIIHIFLFVASRDYSYNVNIESVIKADK